MEIRHHYTLTEDKINSKDECQQKLIACEASLSLLRTSLSVLTDLAKQAAMLVALRTQYPSATKNKLQM